MSDLENSGFWLGDDEGFTLLDSNFSNLVLIRKETIFFEYVPGSGWGNLEYKEFDNSYTKLAFLRCTTYPAMIDGNRVYRIEHFSMVESFSVEVYCFGSEEDAFKVLPRRDFGIEVFTEEQEGTFSSHYPFLRIASIYLETRTAALDNEYNISYPAIQSGVGAGKWATLPLDRRWFAKQTQIYNPQTGALQTMTVTLATVPVLKDSGELIIYAQVAGVYIRGGGWGVFHYTINMQPVPMLVIDVSQF